MSVIAAALGVRDVWNMTPDEKALVQRAHLLLAMYNALQPGVFALSGWDLVGALPLPAVRSGGDDGRRRHSLDQPRRL